MTTIHISTITPILILLLLSQHARAQLSVPGTTPGAPAPADGRRSRPTILTVSINLLIALFFILFLCIYIRFYYTTSPSRNDFVVPRRRLGSIRQSCRVPRGLDIEVIETFPIFEYSAVKSEKIGKGALECAVCLNEFEDDDTLRLIPYCDHVFHPDCIDAWLAGHKTCPVCRCNLADAAEAEQAQVNDVVVEVGDEARESDNNENEVNNNNDSMEQPLRGKMRRSRTMRNLSFGRPRWLGKLARSFSTGHVAALKQLENMERFTLRLPEKVRMQLLMRRKLEKTTSLVVLPRESSTRSCYTSRGRFGSVRVDRSGRWGLSLVPPFITRASSMKSPSVVAPKPTCSQASSLCGSSQENAMGVSGEGSFCDAIQAELSQLPI